MHPSSSLTIDAWDGTQHLGVVTVNWDQADRHGVFRSVSESDVVATEFSLIPGLIDTHVHLMGYAGSGTPDFLGWPLVTRPEEQVLHGLANANRALAVGVTTVRDLSADEVQFSLARAINDGIVVGPRVLAFGMVGMTAGHADLFIPPAFPIRKPTADGPVACRALVRHWARAGADGIKIATSGGVLSVGDKSSWRNYTREEIAAIVDEAHALGMKVAAHSHTAQGIEIALDEGVDSIEHATLITPELAARVVAQAVTVAPTLLINDTIAAGGAGASPEQAAKAADLVARRDPLLRRAAEIGVDFVLGTDANARHVQFGDELTELGRMANVLGWSAERALRSATSAAGVAIGRPDLGLIREGSPADFVIVRGKPWQDIAQLSADRIEAVVVGGRIVVGSLPQQISHG
ncbi:MAG: amidohydrolase family protein [Frondihabitans sp.]|nr:amidohydrolase family protein [Frondihabitans sp.]